MQKCLNRSRCYLGCGLGCVHRICIKLDGVQITPWEGAFLGKRGLSANSCAKTAESRCFWDAESVDPLEIRWGPDASCKGAILEERSCPDMSDDTLP